MTNQNVLINYKVGNSYTELLPIERADGVSFTSLPNFQSAVIGNGNFISNINVKSFNIGTVNAFIFNNLIYQYITNTQTIKIYRTYTLRNGEYFVDVSSTSNPYLLTNMGRLYSTTGQLLYDYQQLLSLSVDVTFNGIINITGYTGIATSNGLYVNTTGALTSLTKVTIPNIKSNNILAVKNITYNGINYIVVCTNADSEIFITQSPFSTYTNPQITNYKGIFKFIQNGVIVTSACVWIPQSGNIALDISTNDCTAVVPYQQDYGGYIFNDIRYNIIHLRRYNDTTFSATDLNTDYVITTNTNQCFVYILSFNNIIIAITQNGDIYNIS